MVVTKIYSQIGNIDTAIPIKRVYATKIDIERFLTIFRKNLMDANPEIKAEIMPTSSTAGDIESVVF